uniref:Uncharacterized protein n=1 Tax=Helianthus annuus TaxID=4232 RepID=A0A251UYU5_HELAN
MRTCQGEVKHRRITGQDKARYGIVGFMKKWSWIWIRVFKKALGQFHDYFIECSTKFYYIV